ncbi:hypothetical protein D3C87_1087980 [compost metagenome]
MVSSMAGVTGPISACWGSSCTPGWPRHVTISNWGRRNVHVSEVSGLTALPRPEFCIIVTPRTPFCAPCVTPAIKATASPSLAAET